MTKFQPTTMFVARRPPIHSAAATKLSKRLDAASGQRPKTGFSARPAPFVVHHAPAASAARSHAASRIHATSSRRGVL